jgi:hypothetical protein
MISQLGMGILLGLTALVLGPPLLKQTRFGSWIGNAYATIAMQTLNRPSIAVGANTDLSLRKRAFDDTYDAEELTAEVNKKITMTPGTSLRWGQRTFTFIDEKFGVTFDLRDVAFGREFMELRRDGEFAVDHYLRDDDDEIIGIEGYVRAFISPVEGPLSMDLDESVRPMVDGNEDATAWNRVWEGVKRMFLPYQQSIPFMKLALPAIMLFGGILAGYYVFGPGALPGTPTPRTVGVGASSLLPLLGRGDDDEDDGDDSGPSRLAPIVAWLREWQGVMGACLVIGGVVAFGLLTAPATTVFIIAGALGTLFVIPLGSSAIISALPAAITEPVAESWLTLAFKAFDDPIVTQNDGKEIRVTEGGGDGPRYRFCKSFVGFDLDCSPDAFGRAGVAGRGLREYHGSAVTDGGTDVPDDVTPTDQITKGGHRGLIPDLDPMDDNWTKRRKETFVRTGRWLGRFADAATGEMCERAQQEATKEFADGSPAMSDRTVMVLSIGSALGGLALAFVLWGLLL